MNGSQLTFLWQCDVPFKVIGTPFQIALKSISSSFIILHHPSRLKAYTQGLHNNHRRLDH